MKILIAVDDNVTLYILELALGKLGYTVEGAPNGRAALEKAQASPPDLIISDVMMPEMDGFMFCKKVKADPRLKNIPVILYTATHSEKDEAELALKLGASRLIVKTAELGPLLDGVRKEVENLKAGAEPRRGAAGAGETVEAEYLRVLSRKLLVNETELKRERDQAKMFLDIAGVMIVALDRDGRISLINRKGCSILGYGEDELLGKNWFDACLPPEIGAEMRGAFAALLTGNVSPPEPYEKPVLTKNGEKRIMAFQNSPILDGASAITGILFSGSDITEQRRAEEALFQAQKMDSIGQLSAGIAHDLNNLLGPVLAYADFLRKSLPAGDPRHDDLDEITKAAGLAAALLRQLLAFSRRQMLEPRVLDLNGIVGGLGGMLQRIIGENIRIVYSPAPSAVFVKVDPVQMEQVIINLAVNARDAMKHGGTLTIATGTSDPERPGEAPAGARVVLTVKDTGCGMDAATLGRIFEPFFTTKGRGRGTGLGLSTVYGIIKQSGGEITAESKPGEGSIFRIYFPRAEGVAGAPGAGRTSVAGKGVVLVAEDNESMRRISKRVLNGAGYEVIEAVNGKEALRLIGENSRSISVLLTDIVMPEMDGVDLAKVVISKYPGIRILCMSGYADKQAELEEVLGHRAGYIQKPFDPDVLIRKLEELLKQA